MKAYFEKEFIPYETLSGETVKLYAVTYGKNRTKRKIFDNAYSARDWRDSWNERLHKVDMMQARKKLEIK